MAPRWPKTPLRCPRWPKMAPRLPQNGPKMVPRRPQGDPKTGVSPRRGANFAKSAMQPQIHSPRGPKVALRRLRTAQDEPRWAQDGPKMAQDGPKMVPRWAQDGPKIVQDGPKMGQRWPKMASNWLQVGEQEVKMDKIKPQRPKNTNVQKLKEDLCF